MELDLTGLEEFKYSNSNNNGNSSGHAWVEDGRLKVKGNVSFEKLMTQMAYQKYGNTCYYCGRSLDKNTRTIDHVIPILYGGVSISPNLVPACSCCNEEKSNLTGEQYNKYRSIEDEENRRRYKLKCIGKNELDHLAGKMIPEEWLEGKKCKLFVSIDFDQQARGAKYSSQEEFFLKYGHFYRPAICASNRILVDGFITVWLAKNENLQHIPLIKLDNLDII